ncbi:MAG: hypothetical protein ACRELY_07845 [Polyangiaceae bacterium]
MNGSAALVHISLNCLPCSAITAACSVGDADTGNGELIFSAGSGITSAPDIDYAGPVSITVKGVAPENGAPFTATVNASHE